MFEIKNYLLCIESGFELEKIFGILSIVDIFFAVKTLINHILLDKLDYSYTTIARQTQKMSHK